MRTISILFGLMVLILGYCLYLALPPRPAWEISGQEIFMAYLPELKKFATREDTTLRLRDVQTGAVMDTFPLQKKWKGTPRYLPARNWWLTSFEEGNQRNQLLLDLKTGESFSLDDPSWEDFVSCWADEKYLVFGGAWATAIFDLDQRENIFRGAWEYLGQVDGQMVLASAKDHGTPHEIQLWNPKTRSPGLVLKNFKEAKLYPEKKLLAGCFVPRETEDFDFAKMEVHVYELPSGKLLHRFPKGHLWNSFVEKPQPLVSMFEEVHEGKPSWLAFHDLATGQKINRIENPEKGSVRFSPKGRWLLQRFPGKVRFRSWPSLEPFGELLAKFPEYLWFDAEENLVWALGLPMEGKDPPVVQMELSTGNKKEYLDVEPCNFDESFLLEGPLILIHQLPEREPSFLDHFLEWATGRERPERQLLILQPPYQEFQVPLEAPNTFSGWDLAGDADNLLLCFRTEDQQQRIIQGWSLPLRKPWKWILGLPIGIALVGFFLFRRFKTSR